MPDLRSLLRWLRALSWPEVRHQPLRHATAVLAVALGVALAFSVHLINRSALAEFGSAVRQVNGEPDLSLRAAGPSFDEAVYAQVLAAPGVALASPVLEVETQAIGADGQRHALRVLGLDALVAPALSPGLLPRPSEGSDRLALLDPERIFLNPAALQALGVKPGASLQLQAGLALKRVTVGGEVVNAGPPLAVIDIAGAQALFDRVGRLSRIDLRLEPGSSAQAVLAALPPGLRSVGADASAQRLSQVSRAYRVNLTVLALVALFTGAFLVFSILALSVAKRRPQLALLGVLGLAARERQALVLAESALLGLVGSAVGVAGGTALAATALRLLGGDLGGGYFPGIAPSLQFDAIAAAGYGALGVAAAMVGGWMPARAAARLAPAQALKNLSTEAGASGAPWFGLGAMAAGGLLALAPPVGGLPIAAYVAVALLLIGGIACVPAVVGGGLALLKPSLRPLPLLAVERARHQRSQATVAVAGVVASLSLAVALTVMVTSFRDAVATWLDAVLPADLYVRSAPQASDGAWLPSSYIDAVAALPGVARAEPLRAVPLTLDDARPAVNLIARELGQDPGRALPLLDAPTPAVAGLPSLWVSEAMVALYGARPGSTLTLPLVGGDGQARPTRFAVRAVWRDYARQHGAVAMDRADYVRLTGDERVNDLAVSLRPGADAAPVIAAVRSLAPGGAPLEIARSDEIRVLSLRIFDRSFAVTYWLQAVAIAIGLFGVAASFSAQALARRKEFGLLAHLGLTRGQLLRLVAGEGLAWTVAGALLGLGLGLVVSAVLVYVVNPQSFHWSMELQVPWPRLALLFAAVVSAGTLTAALAARQAASRQAVLAVKEDW